MDVRLDGVYETAMERLQKHYGNIPAIAVTRQLVYRDAKELGLWPNGNPNDDLEPVYDENGAAG